MDAIEIDWRAKPRPERKGIPVECEHRVQPLTAEFNVELRAADLREYRSAIKACEAHLADLRRFHEPLASHQFREGLPFEFGLRRALP